MRIWRRKLGIASFGRKQRGETRRRAFGASCVALKVPQAATISRRSKKRKKHSTSTESKIAKKVSAFGESLAEEDANSRVAKVARDEFVHISTISNEARDCICTRLVRANSVRSRNKDALQTVCNLANEFVLFVRELISAFLHFRLVVFLSKCSWLCASRNQASSEKT